MSVISPNADSLATRLTSSTRVVSIDKSKLSRKPPVPNEVTVPLNRTFAIGSIRTATVGGLGTLVANGTDSSFVGMRSSYASARRSPLVQTAAFPTNQNTAQRSTSKLLIMPRKTAPADLNPIPEDEKFEFARGARIAFGVELAAAIGVYGIWHLWHLIR